MPRPEYAHRQNIHSYDRSGTWRANLKQKAATQLVISRVYRGGDEFASFFLPATGNEPQSGPDYIGDGFDIRIADARGPHWRGEITTLQFDAQARAWYVEATGYGLDLGEAYDTAVNARNTSTATLITNAISALTTKIDSTSITTSGHTVSNSGDVLLAFLHAGQLIAWASRFDEGAIWRVTPLEDGSRRFTYRERPTASTLFMAMNQFDDADWGFERTPLFTRTTIEYNRGGTLAVPTYSYSTANADATLQDRYGVREMAVMLWALVASADADAVASALLAAAKRPRMHAQMLRAVGGEDTLWIMDGIGGHANRIPPHRVQAGELLAFSDVPLLDYGATNTDFNKYCLIAKTQWSEDTQELLITPENFENTFQGAFGKMEATANRLVVRAA